VSLSFTRNALVETFVRLINLESCINSCGELFLRFCSGPVYVSFIKVDDHVSGVTDRLQQDLRL
jgi:hypothetical protein